MPQQHLHCSHNSAAKQASATTTRSTAETARDDAVADVDEDDDTVTVEGAGAAVVGAGGDGEAGGNVGSQSGQCDVQVKVVCELTRHNRVITR